MACVTGLQARVVEVEQNRGIGIGIGIGGKAIAGAAAVRFVALGAARGRTGVAGGVDVGSGFCESRQVAGRM
jgi:hypothetical protein